MIPRNWIWLLGLLFLAFALRLFQLEVQSIWWDEGISLHLATSEIGEIARDRLNNIHPPLYFFGLKGWLMFLGVNVFSARYLSVLAGWLQVAAIFAIVLRWFSLKTATVAGILAAVSAVSIIYSQEIRVYALLPLIYLALLATTRELTCRREKHSSARWILWLALGLAMWIGLHLHYITLIVVIYVSVWALILFIKQRRWKDLWYWLIVQISVLLASLPWFLAVVRNWKNVTGEANAGTYVTDPVSLQHLLSQVWAFHISGLAGMMSQSGAPILVAVLAVLLMSLFIARLVEWQTRRNTVILLAHWLIPLSSALLVWTVRSFSHPRYIAIFVPGLIILVAYLILPTVRGKKERWAGFVQALSGMLFIGLVAASLWGLMLYFFDSKVAKDDMRSVARYLESTANAKDLILVPDTDWSLSFEYLGDTIVAMPRLGDSDGGWSNLSQLTENTQRVFVVDYLDGTRDWQSRLPFALGKAGRQVDRMAFDGLELLTYELDEPVSAPLLTSIEVNIDPLALKGAWIDQDARTGDSVAVALKWQMSKPSDKRFRVSLRLLDEQDWPVATLDNLLRDANGRPTDQWQTGDLVTTYHLIPVLPAIPPLEYEVRLQVYVEDGQDIEPVDILDEQGAPEGQDTVIGLVSLTYEPQPGSSTNDKLPMPLRLEPSNIVPGLSLLAAEVESGRHVTGDRLTVGLLWQAANGLLDDLRPEVALVQGTQDLDQDAEAPVYGLYPTNLWSKGEMIYERRQLNIPPTVSGKIKVVLRFGGEELVIDEVEVLSRNHYFEPVPVSHKLESTFGEIARLTGFDIAKEEFMGGEFVPLTLVWQSTTVGSDIDYVVFTHILDEEGRLIGQHDSPPGNGTKNVWGWLKDEYVVDHHEILIAEDYQGRATIEVGFYNPATGERILLADGSDHLILPITLTIK